MGLLTFKGGLHPYDGKELSKDKPITEYLPQGELVYPLSQEADAERLYRIAYQQLPLPV